MVSPIVHPARATLIADPDQPRITSATSTTTATRRELLSPGDEATRKARINNELVMLLKGPCPANTKASIQGIGLYTHVLGTSAQTTPRPAYSTQAASYPIFLPIGGPRRTSKDGTVVEAPTSEEMRKVWRDVQQAVNEEEKHVGRSSMSVEQLKERYGALNVLEQSTNVSQLARVQPQLDKAKELARSMNMAAMQKAAGGPRGDGSVIHQVDARRSSLGVEMSVDTIMDGAEQERNGSTSALSTRNNLSRQRTSTGAQLSISEYHESEDPRRRRR
jgi:hypothetical protein